MLIIKIHSWFSTILCEISVREKIAALYLSIQFFQLSLVRSVPLDSREHMQLLFCWVSWVLRVTISVVLMPLAIWGK